MSTTTQPTTYSDLYTELQNRVRVTTGVTATENQAKRYINTALLDMHIGFGEKFWWAERSDMLRTQQKYTTGTVTVNQGSTSLAGASTAWNTNNDFSVTNARVTGKLRINGTNEVYTISAVGSDTAITLDDTYVGSDVSGGDYTYFEDEYTLSSDFLRPIDIQSFSNAMEITLLDRQEFRRRWPRPGQSFSKPQYATLLAKNPAEAGNSDANIVRVVRFHPAPDDFYLIPYSFVTNKLVLTSSGTTATQFSNDDDEPIVPLQYRHAIVLHALWQWYRDKKDDERSVQVKSQYDEVIARIVSDQEIGSPTPQIQPRIMPYRSRAKRPYQRGMRGRHYVTGARFDELR